MIKPLKYQRGGTAASQEQLVQLFQAAAENAQVDPQQLVQKASELGQDEEAAAQFMQGLQLCAQGDPEGIKFIKSLFQSPAFKKGGKIFEFICKHGRGGYVAGCGCKQEGGSIRPGFEHKSTTTRDMTMSNGFGYQERLADSYNVNGEDIVVPHRILNGLLQYDTGKQYFEPGVGYNTSGEKVYSPEAFQNIERFYEETLPNSNRVQGPKEKLAGMQNGGTMQRSLPFTVSSLGVYNTNPAEFEKKAIMMRQRPMYAKCGSKVRK